MEQVIQKLDEMSAKSEQNKAAIEQKFSEEIKGIEEKSTAAIKVVADEVDRLKTSVEESLKKNGKIAAQAKAATFADSLAEQLEAKSAELKGFGSNGRRAVELKTVGNIGSGSVTTSGTETFAGNTFLGIGRKPYEVRHVRQLLSVRPIATDSAYFVRDAGGEGGPTAVAMAAAKPQTDRDYVKLIAPVTKIAHYFKIPEEMLEDNAWLRAEITGVGIEELMAKEDDLILNQAAGAGLFAGLTTATNSTAFAAPASLALGIEGANNYDVLVAAWTQLQTLKTQGASAILCNPADYARMVLSKASTGEYVFGAPNVSIPNVFGIPVYPTNAITSDKFLIGDFSKVALGQRAGISVRFYDQNEDDAIKNMVTVVIEERLTVLADRADRLVYGDFSDARAALETA